MARRTFLDIGAHFGETLSVVRAKRWHFDRIVCFEPAPVCWPSIEPLADERVTICRFGLWKEPATITLHNPGSVGASLAPDAQVVTQTVDCRFEDAAAWFAEHLSDEETVFVKINVEGAEADIVDRLAAADQSGRIDHLLIHFDVASHQVWPTARRHCEASLRLPASIGSAVMRSCSAVSTVVRAIGCSGVRQILGHAICATGPSNGSSTVSGVVCIRSSKR